MGLVHFECRRCDDQGTVDVARGSDWAMEGVVPPQPTNGSSSKIRIDGNILDESYTHDIRFRNRRQKLTQFSGASLSYHIRLK